MPIDIRCKIDVAAPGAPPKFFGASYHFPLGIVWGSPQAFYEHLEQRHGKTFDSIHGFDVAPPDPRN